MEKFVVIVSVYVDDILVAIPSVENCVSVIDKFGEQLVIANLGKPHKIFGWQFAFDDNKILIHHANFIAKIVQHYKLTD
jgi:Reverse transcriptase (RNA-dependent DNA polymerase)